MNKIAALAFVLVAAASAFAAEDHIIRAPAVTLEQAEQRSQALAPATAPAPAPSAVVAPAATVAPSGTAVVTAPPAGQTYTAPAQTGYVAISGLNVEKIRKRGETGIDVTCAITLNGVTDVVFTYEAVLVDAQGRIHTNAHGRPFSASREVHTGDDEDTDKYTVWIPLEGLYVSRPPADLFVQARLIDHSGKIITTSNLRRLTVSD